MTGIVNHFEKTPLSKMTLSTQVVIQQGTSCRDAVLAMADADTSCAFVMSKDDIVGVFTEHDVTHRVVRSPDQWDLPVENMMSPNPIAVGGERSAMDGLRIMTERHSRNLPVRLSNDQLANLTHYDLITLASDFLSADAQEPEEFSAEHALTYVDFNGMPRQDLLEVMVDTSLFDAIQMMIDNDRGLVSVVDERGLVIGEFTQHDVFRKVACRVEELNDEVIGDWMTTENMATALPSASVADGLHEMARKRHRYLVVMNETGRGIGIVTFRDIADYFEAAFVAD